MKRETITEKTQRLGLGMATWSPGDGATRYRFFLTTLADYHSGQELVTCLGRAEAHTWLNGYHVGVNAALTGARCRCHAEVAE